MVKLQITYLLVIGIAFVRMYVNVRGVFQNMADEIQTRQCTFSVYINRGNNIVLINNLE